MYAADVLASYGKAVDAKTYIFTKTWPRRQVQDKAQPCTTDLIQKCLRLVIKEPPSTMKIGNRDADCIETSLFDETNSFLSNFRNDKCGFFFNVET